MARSRMHGSEQLWYLQAFTMLTYPQGWVSEFCSLCSFLSASGSVKGRWSWSPFCTFYLNADGHGSLQLSLSCTQMWQHGFQKGERHFDADWQWFSASRSRPLKGQTTFSQWSPIRHPACQILILQLITLAELQLWSSNGTVAAAWGTIKGSRH